MSKVSPRESLRRRAWCFGFLFFLASSMCSYGFVSRLGPGDAPLRWDFDQFVSVNPPPDQNPVTLAVRFHLPQAGWSAANSQRELDAIRAAFAQWQMVPGTKIKF